MREFLTMERAHSHHRPLSSLKEIQFTHRSPVEGREINIDKDSPLSEFRQLKLLLDILSVPRAAELRRSHNLILPSSPFPEDIRGTCKDIFVQAGKNISSGAIFSLMGHALSVNSRSAGSVGNTLEMYISGALAVTFLGWGIGRLYKAGKELRDLSGDRFTKRAFLRPCNLSPKEKVRRWDREMVRYRELLKEIDAFERTSEGTYHIK